MPKQAPRNFTVEPSISYETLPLTPIPPEGEIKEFAFGLRRLVARAEQPGVGAKRAVWIVHGMGQQVPFETLENITNGLISAADRAHRKLEGPKFRNVRIDKQVMQRVELKIHREAGDPVEVHLYECYWAPKTEGAVKLADVVGFLWDGGTRGLINYVQKFQRALFGQMVGFSLTWRTPFYLLTTLAVLAALTAINAIIVGVSATIAGIGKAQSLIPAGHIWSLTCIAGMVCAVAISFGVTLFLAELSQPGRGTWRSEAKRKRFGNTLCVVTWIALILTVAVIILGGGLMAMMTWFRCVPGWITPPFQRNVQALTNVFVLTAIAVGALGLIERRWTASIGTAREEDMLMAVFFYAAFALHLLALVAILWLALHGGNLVAPLGLRWVVHLAEWIMNSAWWVGLIAFLRGVVGPARWLRLQQYAHSALFSFYWVWPFLFLISAAVRKLLVQYVGDVTAYVASNKLDRFDDLRQKLKDLAHDSASSVYGAKAASGNDFEYGKIAVVGHSLGSVIAYDTLNRLLIDDDLAAAPPPVPRTNITERTSVFLTFGSPLDKVAFFFSIMGKNTRHVREQLAAVVQPLIQDYRFRTFPWLNIYSRNDIICGHLDFYDLPDAVIPPGVENVKDEDAFVPLVAHVDYWGNCTVWDKLLDKVMA